MIRRGFTVIELAVALVISGVVLSAASMLMSALGPLSDRIVEVAERSEREALAWAQTRDAVQMMESTIAGAPGLIGNSREVAFTSRCLEADASLKRCTVSLRLLRDHREASLEASTDLGRSWSLRVEGGTGFLYRLPARVGGGWVTEWRDALLLPAAVAIVGLDTAVFLVGLP